MNKMKNLMLQIQLLEISYKVKIERLQWGQGEGCNFYFWLMKVKHDSQLLKVR